MAKFSVADIVHNRPANMETLENDASDIGNIIEELLINNIAFKDTIVYQKLNFIKEIMELDEEEFIFLLNNEIV